MTGQIACPMMKQAECNTLFRLGEVSIVVMAQFKAGNMPLTKQTGFPFILSLLLIKNCANGM
jgi:hypothetical protein